MMFDYIAQLMRSNGLILVKQERRALGPSRIYLI